MRKLSKLELESEVINSPAVILITSDLAGHRLDWFRENLYANKRKLILLCHDASRLHEIQDPFLSTSLVYECEEDFRFINKLNLDSTKVDFILWDADDKLNFVLKSNYSVRLLIMRPYLTEKSLKSMCNFLIKWMVLFYLEIFRNHEIGLLAIPESKPLILKKNWVDDELLVPNISADNVICPDSKEFTNILVPGYVSARKNPFIAINACADLRERLGLKIQLTFRGKISADIKSAIHRLNLSWVVVEDSYLTRHKYLESLQKCDLILLPYSNRGSSGIVLEGLALSKPVAIYGSRHWKCLSASSGGQLILMQRGVKGISAAIERYYNIDNETKKYYINHSLRRSALDFLIGEKS